MRRTPAPAAGLLLLAAGGCGGGGPEFVPVTGTVVMVVNGEKVPLKGVAVEFLPDGTKGTNGPTARGETDAQGRFTLESPHDGKVVPGAVRGSHKVMLGDTQMVPAPQGTPQPPGRVADKYFDYTKTPLAFAVEPGGAPVEIVIETPAHLAGN